MFPLKPLLLITFMMISTTNVIFDFTNTNDPLDWKIVDDVVMGGISNGAFKINTEGYGEFYGAVSVENNGGFSSARYRFQKNDLTSYSKFVLKVKGDGKNYQFRVKSNKYDYHSYITTIETTGAWQTIEIAFSEMYPAFRGREVIMTNYPAKKMEEIAFLIGNKKNERFKLEIASIKLK